MSGPPVQRAYFKLRAAINATNAVGLSRLNGSVVVSGYPKTGTTFLSHIAEQATGKPYIEGSMRLALLPSVIHTHSRCGPSGSIFSYRPIQQVIPSFVTQRLSEANVALFNRLRTANMDESDRTQILSLAHDMLTGNGRLPSPSVYYRSVRARNGIIVNLLELGESTSPSCRQLQAVWGISAEALAAAIGRASDLLDARRRGGHEFYNRPSKGVASVLACDRRLADLIHDEAILTQNIVAGRNNG